MRMAQHCMWLVSITYADADFRQAITLSRQEHSIVTMPKPLALDQKELKQSLSTNITGELVEQASADVTDHFQDH